ncbi:uncharacterized protein [Amphiura filiformis]|uniref:uncharacterized protein n=1 Tax=Amphiura filiformis TaxID=82378 RepID=UPI003B223982
MVVQTSTAMAENNEDYLDALNDFQRKQGKEIPEELEKLLCQIAQTGEPLFSWNKLKPLVICKLENVIQDYVETNPDETMEILPNVENVEFKDMRERLLQAINAFTNAPFTIQRLCELLTEPRRYYQRSDKFMRGIEKNVQVVSTVTSGGKRIYTSVSHMQTSASSAMVNGIMTDSNGHHDDEDKFDNIATVNKEEHHPTIPAHSAASSDIEAMDTDPSEGNKGVEQTDKKDALKLPVSDDEIAADSKTEDGAKSESRTENIVSDSSETLDSSSVKHDSIGTDNERTSETKDESVTSSTDAEGVHLGEQRPPVENKTESPVSEEADGSSSIQDVSKPPPGNHAPEGTTSSGSDSVLSQSETTSVKSNSEDNAVEESSQSQDTSNGTISDAENTSHSDDNSDKDSSAPPKTCIDEQTVGAQQESAESSAPSEQKEPTSEPGEVNQKQETQAVSSETSLEQTIAEKVDSSQREDDAEESSETQKTTSVTESGDAQLTTETSENSAKQTSEADSESSTQSSDGKVKETDEMEVNSVSSSSSSSQPQQQAKDDQSAKEEESQNTSEVQNVVPTVDEQSSKETENASSTEEAMDQN